mgnify:FL=1
MANEEFEGRFPTAVSTYGSCNLLFLMGIRCLNFDIVIQVFTVLDRIHITLSAVKKQMKDWIFIQCAMPKVLPISLAFCLLCLFSLPVLAQPLPRITLIEEDSAGIQLDGFVDEPVWQDLPVIDGMQIIEPDTLVDAPYQTEIRFFYTERGLYFGIVNHQPPGTLVARMTNRDTRLPRDGIEVLIDASGEGLYGYRIRLNLGDTMADMSVLPERQQNLQWDGSWDGRTQAINEGWSAEFFVPWSMMPLPQVEGTRRIGLAFERELGERGERWSTPPLPTTLNVYLSGFQKYEFRDIEPRRQLTFYPFASTVFDGIKHEADYKLGTDIYWRPTTNTLLSATLNPDFGTVESDDVVVNLTAFETFFREKRTFFLEGQDIFTTSPRSRFSPGPGGPISLLNTKRIGGAARFSVPAGVSVLPTDLSQPTDLHGALKFTGQNGNLRYGTLFASEDDTEIRGTLDDGTQVRLQAQGRDFSVARLLYEDTQFGGRRSIGWMGTDISHPDIDSTVNAIDAHYFSADQKWILDGQIMHSDVNGVSGAGFLGDINYIPRQGVRHSVAATYIDDEFDMNDLGFLSRNSQVNLDYTYSLTESDIPDLRSRNTNVIVSNRWNTDGQPVVAGVFLGRSWIYNDSDVASVTLQYYFPRTDDRLGRGTGDFKIPERWGAWLSYGSDPARPLAFRVNLNANQEDLGPKTITSGAGFAWRPNDRFSFDLSLNYTDREALLIHRGGGAYTSFEAHQWAPRLDVNYFISAKQQFRISGQWNALKAFEDRFWQVNPHKRDFLQPVPNPDNEPDDFVISRLTFQARYRWGIAPLSDLFIVYTRGANLPRNSFYTFQDLLEQAWNDRIVDSVAIKLRYRFGS